MNNKALCLHPSDNVGVALEDLNEGQEIAIEDKRISLIHAISAKHKFAIENFKTSDDILMYGEIIGQATEHISIGEAITMDNIKHKVNDYQLSPGNYHWSPLNKSAKTFKGYLRQDGKVGTANYWLVFPMVFCENQNIETLKEAFEIALGYRQNNPYVSRILNSLSKESEIEGTSKQYSSPFKNVDSIRFITHQLGCGGTRRDAQTLCHLLAGYVNNPNVAGATVLSLGCQNAEYQIFESRLNQIQKGVNKPVFHCDQQAIGTTDHFLEYAIDKTLEGLEVANQIKRTEQSLDKLVIGLECGGSDGFSGISANPTLGRVSDLVISSGGSAILSEFPELCGAEQNLINRCDSEAIAQKFMGLMESYNQEAVNAGSGFDMNPSPGNIKDGLLTDAMKSLGAAKKGGLAPVSDVLDYTEQVEKNGLNLLCTPGNDVESTTGLAGSGANIILFSTGLGTPTGNPICPVIKVASNSKVVEKMPDIIDFDTGEIIRGEKSVEQMGDDLLDLVIQVASGDIQTKADQNSNFDFIPWKRGVSL